MESNLWWGEWVPAQTEIAYEHRRVSTVSSDLLLQSSGSKCGSLFYPEDGSSKFLRDFYIVTWYLLTRRISSGLRILYLDLLDLHRAELHLLITLPILNHTKQ
jgi:hypothetical protein